MEEKIIIEKIIRILNKRNKTKITIEQLYGKNLLGTEVGMTYCDLLLLYFDIRDEFNRDIPWEFVNSDNNFAYIDRIARLLSN